MQGPCTECRIGYHEECWGIDLCACLRPECDTGRVNVEHKDAYEHYRADLDPLITQVRCNCSTCIRMRLGVQNNDG